MTRLQQRQDRKVESRSEGEQAVRRSSDCRFNLSNFSRPMKIVSHIDSDNSAPDPCVRVPLKLLQDSGRLETSLKGVKNKQPNISTLTTGIVTWIRTTRQRTLPPPGYPWIQIGIEL